MSFNICPAPVGSATTSFGVAAPFAADPSRPAAVENFPRSGASKRSEIVQLVHGCESELRIVQSRLGTSAEQVDDAHLARELAHKAKNLRFAIELWEQITARREQPRPAA